MSDELIQAYNYGNYSRAIRNQISLLKLDMKKRLRYAINGGIFEITPEFIIHVKSYYDQGIFRAIFLDINDSPIQIDDVEDFFETIIEKEREVLNWYYLEFTKLKETRDLKAFLDD